MPDIPADRAPDATLQLRADPYRFISARCRAHGSDLFATRVLMEPTICLHGAAAAELFYDTDRFRRAGALPDRIRKLLFGEGGVQGLDGAVHAHRKAMHLSFMTPERMAEMETLLLDKLRIRAAAWEERGKVEMHDALVGLVADVAATWCGLGPEPDMTRRRDQLQSMFEQAGSAGPVYWAARLDRRRADTWARDLVDAVRAGLATPPADSPLAIIADWRDAEGALLPSEVAGVEFLNVLRPITAVGDWLVFVLHALAVEEAPDTDDASLKRFVTEVRRLYPFFPMLGARTTRAFEWQGHAFPADRLVLLDVWGTNRDPRVWDDPDRFAPSRFEGHTPGPFEMIPQGGGDHATGHRCSGEWLTERMMRVAARFFVEELDWDVPEQKLDLDYRRLPGLPRGGMPLSRIARR
ncbi:fatty-acid peroxygenase [Tranquillimonas rosea]|uniref:Fatty-acid peroxygenase n=1 Tax=Tranquillimonas rosea TaxID=641238 RepID=A0A1H9SIX1_9RHOB|nr:cytochrome P450 [Tranquillimonas rosea]SER84901.1 fatty-acid peroxygenase [Tranquillimonas rosea]